MIEYSIFYDHTEENMDVLYFFESIRNPVLNFIFRFFSMFGEEILVLAAVCVMVWCVDKNASYRLGMVFFISSVLAQGTKIALRIERPWVIDPEFEPVAGAKTTATGYSFPSGHTQSATALYSSLAFEMRRKNIKWGIIAAAALIVGVGVSRMYLGVHTPADVIAAFVMTLAIALAVYIIDSKITVSNDLLISLILGAASAALLVYSIVMIENGTVPFDNGVDCCKTAGAGLGFAVARYIERRFINYDVKTPKLWMQAVKLVAGVAGALAVKEGLKLILGTSIAAHTIRYFALVIFGIVIYPLIFTAILKKNRKDNT